MIRLKRLDSVKRELQVIEINRLAISSIFGYGVQGGHPETKAMNHEAKLPKKSGLKSQQTMIFCNQ
jgi:nitrogen regulatory protein P-II 2